MVWLGKKDKPKDVTHIWKETDDTVTVTVNGRNFTMSMDTQTFYRGNGTYSLRYA